MPLLLQVYTRILMFFPVCFRLVPVVFADHGQGPGIAVTIGLVLFTFFNATALLIGLFSLVAGIRHALLEPKRPPLTRLLSNSLTTLATAMSHDVNTVHMHLGTLQNSVMFGIKLKYRAAKHQEQIKQS